MARSIREVKTVVIGGGVVGAAAALALARRGQEVALLERGSLLVARGSSRGTARILQPAAYPDASYLDWDLKAAERWRELEAETQTRLLSETGGLAWGEGVEGFAEALSEAGAPHEVLTAPAVQARFDVSLPPGPILYQPDAGVIHAHAARHALLQSARGLGAELRQNERVLSVAPRDSGAEVETTRVTWRCECAIVAAGPWTGKLLASSGIDLPLSVSSQTVVYFHSLQGRRVPPALVEFGGDGGEPYALWDPREGMKAALHARGPEADPDRDPGDGDAETVDRIVEWVGSRFAEPVRPPRRTEVCLYTNTPDERFLLERHDGLVVGSACSGHGFQAAPETGERLAALAAGADVASGATA